jgi:SAM-dependent methyltransferase
MASATPNTLVPAALVARLHCPACNGQQLSRLVDLPYEDPALENVFSSHYHKPPDTSPLRGFRYLLLACEDCGLAYQCDVPGPAFLPVLYDQWISPENLERAQQSRTLKQSSLMAAEVHFLIRCLGMKPGDIRVLDYGMGWGEWANVARAYGCQAAGADLSTERMRYARSIGLEVFEHENLPIDTFHFVNCEQVFEHLTHPAETLRRLAASLRGGGLLRLSVPDATRTLRKLRTRSFGDLSRWEIMPIAPLQHVNSFTPQTLERFGASAGLRPIRPSLRLLYDATSGWVSREGLKSLVRPLYRHVWPRTTIAYFRKS